MSPTRPTGSGMGTVRSLADYEAYAGISFKQRKIQDYTRRSLEAPNPPIGDGWVDEIYPWMVRILVRYQPALAHGLRGPRILVRDATGRGP